MINLLEPKGSMGNWLPPGEYFVQIKSFKLGTAKTGTEKLEYWCEDTAGKKAKAIFYFTPKALYWLMDFGQKVGELDNGALENFKPEMLIGKSFCATVARVSEGYCQITDWRNEHIKERY